MTMTEVAASEAGTTSTGPWLAVCRLDQLEPLWGEAALVGGEQVALLRLPDGSVRAVDHADPATGAFVMARGIVGSRGGRTTIASPLHKDVFDLDTGECLTTPALRLPVWRSRVRDGVVEVARSAALVAASHGTSDPAGRRAVTALVQAVRESRPDLRVVDAHVDVQQPDVPAAMDMLDDPSRAVVVVPLLLSAGYHVHVDLAEAAADAAPREVRVTGALGPDPRLATVLARRLREAGLRDGDRVVLAAAGSSDAGAVADCHVVGGMLAAELGREVVTSFISAARPRVPAAVRAEREAHPGSRVVVATYLLAPGYFATLAERAGGDATSAPLLVDGEAPPAELVDIVVELHESASVPVR
jgi:NAD(P)H-dependent nitrite reductase small subunit